MLNTSSAQGTAAKILCGAKIAAKGPTDPKDRMCPNLTYINF